MQYAILGSTGIKVSRIALGTATFGVAPTAAHTDRLVGQALDLGRDLARAAAPLPPAHRGHDAVRAA